MRLKKPDEIVCPGNLLKSFNNNRPIAHLLGWIDSDLYYSCN